MNNKACKKILHKVPDGVWLLRFTIIDLPALSHYMKHLLPFIVAAFTLCLAGGQSNEKLPARSSELRKEHEEKRDQDGKINAYVDTVFRGNVRVLMTVRTLTKNKYGIKMTRAYFAGGKDVVDEIHYDDGTQRISLYKEDILCEMFRRQGDGSLEPVSSEELVKFKGQQKDLMETLEK
jgi:hypothetical protein